MGSDKVGDKVNSSSPLLRQKHFGELAEPLPGGEGGPSCALWA
jgi:hypothetical protein